MATLKTWNGIAKANVKTFNTLANASWKTYNGLTLAAGDPYWSSVVLLAGNDNAADTSTTFTDQSGSAHALTGAGNIQYDSATAPTGMTTTILSDGTGDIITTPDSDDWSLGTGDFTLEFWVRMTTLNYFFIGPYTIDGDTANGWVFVYNNATKILRFGHGTVGTTVMQESWSPSVNVWYAVAMDRSGDDWRIYVDGTQLGTTDTVSATVTNGTVSFAMMSTAALDAFGLNLIGNFGPLRLTKGVARYVGSYTPPALPLPSS